MTGQGSKRRPWRSDVGEAVWIQSYNPGIRASDGRNVHRGSGFIGQRYQTLSSANCSLRN